MKMKIAKLVGLMSLAIVGLAQAQDNWNWPSDSQAEATARGHNAAYNDFLKAKEYLNATKPLHWLLVNAPDLNEALYINGVQVYAGAAEVTKDEAQKEVYQDSVMLLYDKRQELYQNEEKWIENKAYYAYRFYKDDKERVGEAADMFDRAMELNGTVNPNLIAAYFDLIYRNYAYNKAYTPEQILERYEKLNAILDEAAAKGSNVAQNKETLDQLLIHMEIIDCDFIENNLGPKLKADPSNMKLAQQIFQYSVQYKCTTTPAFMTALEVIDENDPTFSTSQVIARRYQQTGDFARAQEMFEKALSLAKTNDEKADVHLDLAKLHSGQGRKAQARTSALKAAELSSNVASDAWTIIGNLYLSSTNDCRGGQSRVKDYSIFIAAYDAFAKAGNNQGMSQAKARFPSKEELFTEGYQVGETLNTGCWIGQTVTLATRD
ncbi:MAG TPA: tetratricopeptide repeat protein [Cyclobacteriaceae bacterium]|nr:tetratricopeptide repeat protein [Cyclobacteriaceae bacterium]